MNLVCVRGTGSSFLCQPENTQKLLRKIRKINVCRYRGRVRGSKAHKQLVYKPLIACSCVFKNTGARGEPGHTRDGHTDHTDEPRNQADSQVTTNTAKTPQPIRIPVPVHYGESVSAVLCEFAHCDSAGLSGYTDYGSRTGSKLVHVGVEMKTLPVEAIGLSSTLA